MKKTYLLALAALASTALAEPPQQIDIKNLPGGAKMVDDVVVPVPSEIFNVLDKVDTVDWARVLREMGDNPTKPFGPREQIALVLGTVIAEGFIAVEAKNSQEVKNIGRSVLLLAEPLSVRKVVVQRSKAIIDGADKKQWTQVRRELDKAQHDVQAAMAELNDGELAQLVSLGGWVRGTEALASVVAKGYKKDSAELLHQPVLVEFFVRKLESGAKFKNKPLVEKAREALNEIKPLMGTEGAVISEKTVGEIKAIATRLINLIHAKEKP